LCIFNKDNITLIKEIPRIQAGGNMKTEDEIPIIGAVSLDNEFTREYVNAMKDFHKTFKPLPKKEIMPAYKEPSKRKTRKRRK